jgi:nitroreductase
MAAGVAASQDPWRINETEFAQVGGEAERLRFLVRYAVLAPSSHNTQPWRFRVSPNRVEVYADRSRWLKVADPDERELYISIGCALENLCLAAERFGYSVSTRYHPDDRGDRLATANLEPARDELSAENLRLFGRITQRRTNRRPYRPDPADQQAMAWLGSLIGDDRIWRVSSHELANGDDLVNLAADLAARADEVEFADPAFRRELGVWVGRGLLGTSWLGSKLAQLALTGFDLGRLQGRSDAELVRSAPVVLCLGAAEARRETCVRLGRVFQRLALGAEDLGLAMHPMSQIVQVRETRERLAAALPKGHEYPLHVVRLGYPAHQVQHTPRRPLAEVLD